MAEHSPEQEEAKRYPNWQRALDDVRGAIDRIVAETEQSDSVDGDERLALLALNDLEALLEDRSKAFERAAADCVRLEGALRLFADVDAWSMNEDDRERFGFEAGPWHFDPETDDGNETPWDLARAALFPAEAEGEQHARAEHLREAREVERHQEEKHERRGEKP